MNPAIPAGSSIASLYEPLALQRGEFLALLARRDSLAGQRAQLRTDIEDLNATARSDDAAAVRSLTESKVRLELVERDFAAVEQAIPAARSALAQAARASVHTAQATREAEVKRIEDILAAKYTALRAPYVPALEALASFDFQLRDLAYVPDSEQEIIRNSGKLLNAWAGFKEAITPA